jgi:sulfur carrier protein ThiS
MKIRVKLYGTLRGNLPADVPSEDIEIEVPQEATAGDLLVQLGIAESRRPVVVMEGRVLATNDPMKAGARIAVFQAIGGG